VPEPEPIPEPPKRRGRPPGSKSKPKEAPVKRNIPWVTICRSLFWSGVTIVSLTSLYRGVEGWLGQNAAYITLAVTVIIAAVLLDRGWQKIRSNA
jgi:hypothetical protein